MTKPTIRTWHINTYCIDDLKGFSINKNNALREIHKPRTETEILPESRESNGQRIHKQICTIRLQCSLTEPTKYAVIFDLIYVPASNVIVSFGMSPFCNVCDVYFRVDFLTKF